MSMIASISITSGAKMTADFCAVETSRWLSFSATDANYNRFSITFLTIEDAERAAHAILDAVAKARPSTAPQGLVVEDVV